MDNAGKAESLPDLVGFTDSDFAGCAVALRSTSGTILYYRGCPVLWSSRRQSVKALSTCEAEYIGMFDLVKVSQSQGYLDWFLLDRKFPLMFADNQSAIALAKSSLVTKRSKHIELRFHVVRDHFGDFCYCPTDINRADPLTKSVPAKKYLQMFKHDATETPYIDDEDETVEEGCTQLLYIRF